MLKRFGACSKKRNMGKSTRPTSILVTGDRPENSEDDPAAVVEGNKVTLVTRKEREIT